LPLSFYQIAPETTDNQELVTGGGETVRPPPLMYYTAAIYHGALLNMNNDYKCHFSGAPINATPISCRYRVYFSCWLDYRKMIKHFGGNRSGKDNDTRMPNVFTGRELTQSVGAAAASTNKNVFQLLLPRTKPHLIFNFSFFLSWLSIFYYSILCPFTSNYFFFCLFS
jgi:hypothetical protein